MASAGSGDGEPEFQIAPMIDVLLVLLVFFVMISSAEVLKIDKRITLPVSPNANPREKEMLKHETAVNLRLETPTSTKGILSLDDIDYPDWQEVVPILTKRKKDDPLLRAIIRADAGMPAGEIQRVMDLVGQSGIADIAFSASNKAK